jgi:hypothetical protein
MKLVVRGSNRVGTKTVPTLLGSTFFAFLSMLF